MNFKLSWFLMAHMVASIVQSAFNLENQYSATVWWTGDLPSICLCTPIKMIEEKNLTVNSANNAVRESGPGQSAGPARLCTGSLPPTSLFLVCSCGKYEVCSCAVSWKIERLQQLLLVNRFTDDWSLLLQSRAQGQEECYDCKGIYSPCLQMMFVPKN